MKSLLFVYISVYLMTSMDHFVYAKESKNKVENVHAIRIVKDFEERMKSLRKEHLVDLKSSSKQQQHHGHFNSKNNNNPSTKPRAVGPRRHSIDSRAHAIQRTLDLIELQSDKKNHLKNQTYFLSWNELSDLSEEEYRSFLKSGPNWVDQEQLHRNLQVKQQHQHQSKETSTEPIPKEWNWQTIENGKFLSPIKNQGPCGSCWVFAAVSAIESRYAIQHKVPAEPLSVEQILSCSADLDHLSSEFDKQKSINSSSSGCKGGMPFLAFEYLEQKDPHGIACAEDYPYLMATGEDEVKCIPSKEITSAISYDTTFENSYENLPIGDEEALLQALMEGPVTANVDASSDTFRLYGGGIYDAKDCASDGESVNHAILIVGFGENSDGEKYWTLQNTWGSMWGENGFMRIKRPSSNENAYKFGPCNLYLHASYPIGLRPLDTKHSDICTINADGDGSIGTAKTHSVVFSGSLSFTDLLGLSRGQVALLALTAFSTTIISIVILFITEQQAKNKQTEINGRKAAFYAKYRRWILPSAQELRASLEGDRRLVTTFLAAIAG